MLPHLAGAPLWLPSTHAALRGEIAARFRHHAVSLLPHRGRHQIEAGIDDHGFRPVEPQPAVADDDEPQRLAEVGRNGQRRARCAS